MNNNMTDIDPEMSERAVVYQGDMTEEFPVLKAFQQYIDAEQAKSRKRMMSLCLFFSIIMMIVIGVFVSLLIVSSSRNQSLNDRLVEYAMKDREQASLIAQASTKDKDEAALRALSDKFENLQKTLAEDRERLEKKVSEEMAAAKEKKPSAEMLEIERLKALLAAAKEKASAEREKQRHAELEAYRRKYYPECYAPKLTLSPSQREKPLEEDEIEADREIEAILKDVKAIKYFEDDEEYSPETKNAVPSKDDVEIPNGIKDFSGNTWSVPEE